MRSDKIVSRERKGEENQRKRDKSKQKQNGQKQRERGPLHLLDLLTDSSSLVDHLLRLSIDNSVLVVVGVVEREKW